MTNEYSSFRNSRLSVAFLMVLNIFSLFSTQFDFTTILLMIQLLLKPLKVKQKPDLNSVTLANHHTNFVSLIIALACIAFYSALSLQISPLNLHTILWSLLMLFQRLDANFSRVFYIDSQAGYFCQYALVSFILLIINISLTQFANLSTFLYFAANSFGNFE